MLPLDYYYFFRWN